MVANDRILKQHWILILAIAVSAFTGTRVFAQVSISDPGCVVVGEPYIFNYIGPNPGSTSMSWCISSNGTILQAFGTDVSGTGLCRTGSPIGSIYVQWNSVGTGYVSLTSSLGNANIDFPIVNALNPGSITSNGSQTIAYNTIPSSISCSAATYGYCSPVYSYQWQQSTNNVSWTNIDGQTSQDLTFSSPLLETTYLRRKVTETNTNKVLYSDVATVFVNPPFSSATISPAIQNIYIDGTATTISGQAASGGSCGGNYTHQWESSSDNGSTYSSITNASGLSYTPGPLTQTTYFRRKDTCGSEVSFSNSSVVNVYQHLNAGTISPSSLTISFNTSPGFLTVSSATGDQCSSTEYSYQWEISTDGVTFSEIPGATTNLNYNPGSLTITSYFRRRVRCFETAYTNVAVINVNPQLFPGSIVPGSLAIPPNTSPGLLYAEGASGGNCNNNFVYQWQQSLDGQVFTDIAGANGETYTPGILSANSYYRRKVTCGIDVQYTNVCTISIITATFYNYIQVRDIQIPDVKNVSGADMLTDPYDVIETTQYFDGLGRVLQTINRQASPLGKDVVVPNVYDEFGREQIKYLPYVSDDSNGEYKPSPIVEQANFYSNGLTDKVADDIIPFSQTIFESSPLNRVLKQGAPGEAWKPNPIAELDKSIKKSYGFNAENEIYLFKYDPQVEQLVVDPESKYFEANQLYLNKTLDEHSNEVIEYVDKEGRTLCKKVQYGVEGSTKLFAVTYYVYDDFGNLIAVIPPEGIKAISSLLE